MNRESKKVREKEVVNGALLEIERLAEESFDGFEVDLPHVLENILAETKRALFFLKDENTKGKKL